MRTTRWSTILATELGGLGYGPGGTVLGGGEWFQKVQSRRGTTLPPMSRLTDTCENITFPQTTVEGGKK